MLCERGKYHGRQHASFYKDVQDSRRREGDGVHILYCFQAGDRCKCVKGGGEGGLEVILRVVAMGI